MLKRGLGQRPIYPRGSGRRPEYIPRSARQSLAYIMNGVRGGAPNISSGVRGSVLYIPQSPVCSRWCRFDVGVPGGASYRFYLRIFSPDNPVCTAALR